LTYVFAFFVFPGLLFAAAIGLISKWIDRKVTALVQWRVGPPLLQPLYDIIKLMCKEVIIPAGSRRTGFFTAPLIGLAGATLAATILGMANLKGDSFIGDLIVIIYLLVLPSLAVIIGGSTSGNPLAALGASREMKLILAYELPFLLAVATVIVKAGGTLKLAVIAQHFIAGSISGFLALIVAILCTQAKLAYVPFDIPEAETEISSGPYIEYSGALLGIFKLTQAMMLFILPLFTITVFLGGINTSWQSILLGIIKYVILVTIIVLIKNTNPRSGSIWK